MLLIFAMVLPSSCYREEKRQADAALVRAERQTWTNPDSALATLQAVSGHHKRRETEARYALLLTQALYRTGQPPTNDSLMLVAADYYDNSSDSLRKAWIHYYLASFCIDHSQRNEALNHFRQAERAGLATKDHNLLGKIYSYWGYSLLGIQPYEQSLDLTLKAQKYLEEIKDTTNLIFNYRITAEAYGFKRQNDFCVAYLNKAIDAALCSHRTDLLFLPYIRMSQEYEYQKDYPMAMNYLRKAEQYAQAGDSSQRNTIYFTKAYIYKGMQRYDSAAYYQSLSDTSRLIDKAVFHMEMSDIRKAQKRYVEALHHQELYARYLDSLYTDQESRDIAEIQKKYEYNQVQYKYEKLRSVSRLRGIVVLCVSFTLVIVIAGGAFLRYKSKQKRREALHKKNEVISQIRLTLEQKSNELLTQQQALQEKGQELRSLIEQQQTMQLNIQLKNEQLQTLHKQQEELRGKEEELRRQTSYEIEQKEQLLASLQAKLAETEKREQELLQSVERDCIAAASADRREPQAQLDELLAEQRELKEHIFRTHEVVKKVESLKSLNSLEKTRNKAKLLLSENDKKELYQAINHCYNNLEAKLRERYPQLSEDDIYICCLIRMGVENNDLTFLTGSSKEALKKRKYRIKSGKLNNADKELSLEEILKKM